MTERARANLVYFTVALVALIFVLKEKYDTPVATNEVFEAEVYKSYPHHDKYKPKRVVHIRVENGAEFTLLVNAYSKLNTGSSLSVRKYKAKISGTTTYKITS